MKWTCFKILVALYRDSDMNLNLVMRAAHKISKHKSCEIFFSLYHRSVVQGVPPKGDKFTSFSKCSILFIQSVKSIVSKFKSCNPVKGTPSSAVWNQESVLTTFKRGQISHCDSCNNETLPIRMAKENKRYRKEIYAMQYRWRFKSVKSFAIEWL